MTGHSPPTRGTTTMIRTPQLTRLLSASLLCIAACATVGDDGTRSDRDAAIEALHHQAGAPVALETSALGTTRIIAATPGFPIPGHATAPAEAAVGFLTSNHDAFQLDAADAASFVVTRVDVEPHLPMSHVTLQRVLGGIPVFQGAITVHLDAGNGVFRALGDESYRVAPPTNRMHGHRAEHRDQHDQHGGQREALEQQH